MHIKPILSVIICLLTFIAEAPAYVLSPAGPDDYVPNLTVDCSPSPDGLRSPADLEGFNACAHGGRYLQAAARTPAAPPVERIGFAASRVSAVQSAPVRAPAGFLGRGVQLLRTAPRAAEPAPSAAISIVDDAEPYGFLDSDKAVLRAMLDLLPPEHLAGIRTIRSKAAPVPGMGYALEPDGVITLYVMPKSMRSEDLFHSLLAFWLTGAVGENVFRSILTPAEKDEWNRLAKIDASGEFASGYSLWTLYSPGMIQEALSRPGTAQHSLAQTLFIGSLFRDPGRASLLKGFMAGDMKDNLIQPGRLDMLVTYLPPYGTSDGLLKVGEFGFRIKNGAIIGWDRANGTSGVVSPSVLLPQLLKTRVISQLPRNRPLPARIPRFPPGLRR